MPVSAFRRFAFAYGTTFAIFYVLARARGIALFTVYPSFGIVLAGMHNSRDIADPAMAFLAPEIWWFGWMSAAAAGAFATGLFAVLLPKRWHRWFWSGWVWVVPIAAMMGCVYLTLPWFRL